MVKKLLIILVFLGVLFAGLGLLAVSNASSILNQYKPQIESLLSDSIGAPVSLGAVTTEFFPETKIKVDELVVGDVKKGESLSLKGVALRVDPMPLLQKRIVVEELILSEPEILIINDAAGLHIPGKQSRGETPVTSPGAKASSSDTSLPISLSLKKVSMTNGKVTYDDKITSRQIALSHLALSSAVSFEGQTAVLKDLKLNGTIQEDARFEITSSEIKSGLAKSTSSDMVKVSLGGSSLSLLDLKMGSEGSLSYRVKGEKLDVSDFTNLASKLNLATIAYKGTLSIDSTQHLDKQGFEAQPLTIEGFGGSISAPITVRLGEQSSFTVKPSCKSVQIDQAMSFLAGGAPSKLFGIITESSGTISAPLGAQLKAGMAGKLSFAIEKGGLRGINIAAKALKNADKIPLLAGSLFSYVPKEFQGTLAAEDTEFDTMSGGVTFRGGAMILQDVKLRNKVYGIDAEGSVGFDSQIDLNATITFSRDFSLALVNAAHDLKKILTPEETLVLPLTIKGTLPGVIVVPNLSKVIQLAGEKFITEKAVDALGKALGGKGKGLGSLFKF